MGLLWKNKVSVWVIKWSASNAIWLITRWNFVLVIEFGTSYIVCSSYSWKLWEMTRVSDVKSHCQFILLFSHEWHNRNHSGLGCCRLSFRWLQNINSPLVGCNAMAVQFEVRWNIFSINTMFVGAFYFFLWSKGPTLLLNVDIIPEFGCALKSFSDTIQSPWVEKRETGRERIDDTQRVKYRVSMLDWKKCYAKD